MPGEDGHLEHHVLRQVTGLPHPTKEPKQALVQHQKSPKAQLHCPEDVGDHVAKLVRAPEPKAGKGPLRGDQLPPGVPTGAGPGGDDHLHLGLGGDTGEVPELGPIEKGRPHHRGDHPVHRKFSLLGLGHHGLQHLRPLHPGDLHAVLGPVRKPKGALGKLVGVPPRDPVFLHQPLYLTLVHLSPFLPVTRNG